MERGRTDGGIVLSALRLEWSRRDGGCYAIPQNGTRSNKQGCYVISQIIESSRRTTWVLRNSPCHGHILMYARSQRSTLVTSKLNVHTSILAVGADLYSRTEKQDRDTNPAKAWMIGTVGKH